MTLMVSHSFLVSILLNVRLSDVVRSSVAENEDQRATATETDIAAHNVATPLLVAQPLVEGPLDTLPSIGAILPEAGGATRDEIGLSVVDTAVVHSNAGTNAVVDPDTNSTDLFFASSDVCEDIERHAVITEAVDSILDSRIETSPSIQPPTYHGDADVPMVDVNDGEVIAQAVGSGGGAGELADVSMEDASDRAVPVVARRGRPR